MTNEEYLNSPEFLKAQVRTLSEALEEAFEQQEILRDRCNDLQDKMIVSEARKDFHMHRLEVFGEEVMRLCDEDNREDFLRLDEISNLADGVVKYFRCGG